MNKNLRTLLLLFGAVVILVLVSSPRFRQLFSGSPEGESVQTEETRLPVEALVVRPQALSNKVLTSGTVLADEEVDLRSEVSGTVRRIAFAEGGRVRKGELLVKIDDSELRAQLKRLESERNLAADKERRRRELYSKQNISPEDYQVALNELNAVQAEVELYEARIAKTEIRAPFDGTVGLRFVSEGSYVTPAIRIATLQDARRVKLDFAVPERYASTIRPGLTIRFHLSGTDETFEGIVYAIEPKIDPATRSLLLRARAPNPRGHLVPGAFAEIELVVEEIPNALMVPTQALVPDLQGQKVYVVERGAAREQRVETGIRTDTQVQITAGLAPLDTVITSGILQIAPGLPLDLTEVR
jgi:membrane fusion protein (multidrug efflux system)